MKVKEKTVILKDGKSMTLRSIAPEEAEVMIEHLQITHAESYRNLNQPPTYWQGFAPAEEAKILTDFENSLGKFLLGAFVNQKIVGGLGFVGGQGDFLRHSARIGMSIQRAFGNCGLGTEMMKYALSVGEESGFHRVELSVRTYNSAGIALYEKSGFQRVGLLKAAAKIDGEYVDEYLYQILL
jgi:RimJ/RimL family protein N-acetyltransferase